MSGATNRRGLAGVALLLGSALLVWTCGEDPPSRAAPVVTPAPGASGMVAPAPTAAVPPKPAVVRDDGPPWPVDPPPFPGERFTWLRDGLPGWTHVTSESGEYRMPEVVCGGVVLFDADGDRDLDIFLVNGGTWNDLTPGATYPGHGLFRNDGAMRFVNVAREAGVFGVDGTYCMGAAAADCDNDGDQDLYVTGFTRNFLYRNEGANGGALRFVECAEELGVRGNGQWSASACFFDANGDGRLDLYVANYIAFTFEANRKLDCGGGTTGVRDYCAPKNFFGLQGSFFQQQPDGRFRERAREAGLKATEPLSDNSKGLGVVTSDVDDDGDLDLFVANDGCANFLFVNDGTGRFTECGTSRGCAYNEDGQSQAGMGTDAGDVDGDGDFDLWVVNLDLEMNGLYRNDDKGWFTDDTKATGLTAADRGQVGFGTDLFDADNDGDPDILIANGHVLVNIHRTRGTLFYRQADQYFENDGTGRFRLLPPEQAGAYFLVRNAARGLATGDLDGDGDLDSVITARDEPAVLLRNNHVPPGERARAILLDLEGVQCNRDAIGARVWWTTGGRTRTDEVRAGNSYCSRSDRRLHLGVGTAGTGGAAAGAGGAASIDKLEIRWPDGTRQTFTNVAAGFEYALMQGGELVQRRELKG